MLYIANSLKELNFRSLMEVYIEGNMEKAEASEFGVNQGLLEAEQDFYQYLRESFFQVQGACYAIWLEAGEYVSAVRFEPYRDGVLLQALETAPEHRRKGYACKLTQQALAQLKFSKVYSHVSKKNAASMAVHSRCGFEKILDFAAYIDGSVNRSAVTLLWQPKETVAESQL